MAILTVTNQKAAPYISLYLLTFSLHQSIAFSPLYQSNPPSTSLSSHATNSAFINLIQSATHTLTSSDTSENEIEHSYGSASQGQWICSETAGEMQRDALEGLVLKQTKLNSSSIEETARNNTDSHHQHPTQNAFQLLVKQSLHTLIQSDVNRGEFSGNSDGSSSQGRWMDALSGEKLGRALDRLVLNLRQTDTPNATINSQTNRIDQEQQAQWIKWMKNVPSPLFLDLTSHIHQLIIDNHHNSDDPWIPTEHLEFVDMSLERYISRISCHVILLPSGGETAPLSLVESTGAHVYGKLLYGGVNRFRMLTSGRSVRRVGEKRECMEAGERSHPSWVQLGGLERKYEALDIGPAAVLELTLLPRLWQDLPTVFDKSIVMGEARTDMVLSGAAFGWDPSVMLDLVTEEEDVVSNNNTASGASETKTEYQSTGALSSHFQSRVGGLQTQIDAIIRRVLDGRADPNDGNSRSRLEAEELAALGLHPVRGLLLYGKPGTGKTLLVREIARTLGARPPKIVAAPELLDRWVGGSERCVRELFREAEEELAMCKMTSGSDDNKSFLQSGLHVIVIDEIDAVFRKRIDTEDSGSITRNSVVNQLLSKLDGVNALPNILMIGMTNRKELLDDALLRPGRLEVHVEVPLPSESGRREIMQIHFGSLRRKGRLSYPLCCAIDGIRTNQKDQFDTEEIIPLSKRQHIKNFARKALRPISVLKKSSFVDLASNEFTEGFTGADLAGLVRNAGSIALSRARTDGSGVDGLLITLEDVMQALEEVKV